jgi:hypothetical protein
VKKAALWIDASVCQKCKFLRFDSVHECGVTVNLANPRQRAAADGERKSMRRRRRARGVKKCLSVYCVCVQLKPSENATHSITHPPEKQNISLATRNARAS